MILAHFEDVAQEIARAYGVYQYDWGQRLQVTGLESLHLPNHTEVHFEIEGEETAITRVSTVTQGTLVVDVPFKCLQFARKVTAYIYVLNTDASGGKTIKQVVFIPHARTKPDDDITPEEERTVDAMVKTLNKATEQANIDVEAVRKAAETAVSSSTKAAESKTKAEEAKTAAAAAAAAAAASEKNVADNTAAVQEMYNNMTINVDGGDASHIDYIIIDGGTAETTP